MESRGIHLKHRTVVAVGVALAAAALSVVVSGQPQTRPATLDDFLIESGVCEPT